MVDIDAYADVARQRHSASRRRRTVSFVAHSMGNIVIRRYLKNLERLAPAMRPPVKFQRMVMISPPNHGAELADTLIERDVTRELAELFAGEPPEQLAPVARLAGAGEAAGDAELRVRHHRRRQGRRRGLSSTRFPATTTGC